MKFTRKAGGALALLILAVAGTWAAEVADVRFEQQGAQILSPEQIELNVQLHKGSQYTREILDADVKRLYNTGNFADVEVRTPNGRVDVVMRTHSTLYVIELKLDKSAEAAMQQIDLKQYPERFALCGLPVVKIGINFDKEKRTLSDWQVERV